MLISSKINIQPLEFGWKDVWESLEHAGFIGWPSINSWEEEHDLSSDGVWPLVNSVENLLLFLSS